MQGGPVSIVVQADLVSLIEHEGPVRIIGQIAFRVIMYNFIARSEFCNKSTQYLLFAQLHEYYISQ